MKEIIEFFNNSQYINVFTGISSLGTFIAALVALLTLRLIIKQIRNSQGPNVTFGNSLFAKCYSTNDRILKTIWSSGEEESDDCASRLKYSTLNFELINVGIGFAENVCLQEKLDIKAAISFIEKIDRNNEFVISIEDSVLRIYTTFDSDFERITLTKTNRKLGNFKSVSINGNKESRYIFNEEYLAFLSCFGYLRDNYDEFLSLDEFPKLKFILTFKDIDGKRYKSNFECSAFCISGNSYSLTITKK